MTSEITSFYHLKVIPSQFEAFHALVAVIVEASRKEVDTLTYEYWVDADKETVHIIEHYRMPGVLPHIEQTFAPHAEAFLSFATIEKLFVYGEPTPEVRAKLDGFGAIYLSQFEGFRR